MGSATTINISPGVSVLSLFRHLNYKPWFALGEFVDNPLQSFLDYRDQLEATDGNGVKLIIKIEYSPNDGGQITIRDNAAGIHENDYARAFKAAQPPPSADGLCQFGVGMKSAACWFANQWSVRTTALGENVERTIFFDIQDIVQNSLEELSPTVAPAYPSDHYTEIVLRGLHNPIHPKTIGKIKDHLASIYRTFIRSGILELWFGDEILMYSEPEVLKARYFRDESGEQKIWRKEIDLDFGQGLRATGFVALRQTASTSGAGFALFRHDRLIQGSADEGYRPEFVFKKSNSYTYQRLFGELHLEGFDVTHTKDGFRWGDNEGPFLELLREIIDEPPLPLIDQAEGYRVRAKPEEIKQSSEVALESTARVIREQVPPVLEKQLLEMPDDTKPPSSLSIANLVTKRLIDVELNGTLWRIDLELSTDPGVGEWISISDELVQGLKANRKRREVGARLSLAHPFMDRFAGTDPERIEPLLRVATAIALAEVVARDSGVKLAGTIRRNINELLRNALSKP